MSKTANAIFRFLKDWTLPISMLTGVVAYFTWKAIPGHEPWSDAVNATIAWVQPVLIFCMLLVSFCKVKLKEFTFKWWHLWLGLFQLGMFALLAAVACLCTDHNAKVVVECAMLCFICPTATAAAVVTSRLGGNQASLISYTIIINLVTSLAVPLVLPHVYNASGMDFLPALLAILAKVFPLLICPLFVACLIRQFLPRLNAKIISYKNLAFYLWAISLALAIAVSTKSLVHSTVNGWCQLGMAIVTFLACIAQFAFGKRIGDYEGERISGGQACGQKNTVFAIWLGYTFLDPVTALAGGFYSIWHNMINSVQLYRKQHTPQQ